MWPSIDVKYAAKIDPEVILLTEYKRLIRVMFEENLDVFKKLAQIFSVLIVIRAIMLRFH